MYISGTKRSHDFSPYCEETLPGEEPPPAKRQKTAEKPPLLPPLTNLTHHILREELLTAIEHHYTDEIVEKVEEKISSFAHLPFSEQMAELGILLRLLDRGGLTDEALLSPSLLMHYSATLCKAIAPLIRCKERMSTHLPEHAPSGKTYILLHAFANLTLTSTQKVNLGGVYALVAMLNIHVPCVARFLRNDHRLHILAVAKNILSHTGLQCLLETQASVHDSLAPLIRLDLKLPPNTSLDSEDIMLAAVQALYTDVRQDAFENCYAVSSVIYATENATYKTLRTLLTYLDQGTYITPYATEIPLFPLVERRLCCHIEMVDTLAPKAGACHPIFTHIATILDSTLAPEEDKSCSLYHFFRTYFKDPEYAIRLYNSYKDNYLIQLLIAVAEFHGVNVTEPEIAGELIPSKGRLIEYIEGAFPLSLANTWVGQRFISTVRSHLWLQNNDAPLVGLGRENTVQVYYQGRAEKTLKCEAISRRSLGKYIAQGHDLCYIDIADASYRRIDSLSGLQQALTEIADSAHILTHDEDDVAELKAYISSSDFRNAVILFCEGEEEPLVSPDELDNLDLFLYTAAGAAPIHVLADLFQLATEEVVLRSSSVSSLVENLYTCLQQMTDFPQRLLVENDGHSYTFNPQYFPIEESFEVWKERAISRPVGAFLDKKIPLNEQEFFIHCIDDEISNETETFFAAHPRPTYGEFHSHLTHSTSSEKKEWLDLFDEMAYTIELTEQTLMALMHELPITIAGVDTQQLMQMLTDSRFLSSEHLFVVAQELSAYFMDTGLLLSSPFEMAQALCRVFHLPQLVYCGDDNGSDAHREDPFHIHYIARYHFGNQQLELKSLTGCTEEEVNFNEFKILQIKKPK